jgi:hypothetical protein
LKETYCDFHGAEIVSILLLSRKNEDVTAASLTVGYHRLLKWNVTYQNEGYK